LCCYLVVLGLENTRWRGFRWVTLYFSYRDRGREEIFRGVDRGLKTDVNTPNEKKQPKSRKASLCDFY
jgi:hypothetical protein